MTIQGKSVYSGVAIGRLAIYQKSENQVKREKITDTAKEIKRFEDARETAKQQLAGLYEKALKEVGEVNAAIFESTSDDAAGDAYLIPHLIICARQKQNA